VPSGGSGSHGGSDTLEHFVCEHSSQARQRTISVQAVMRHRAGTQQMGMRFELLWTSPGSHSGYKEHGGDLGQWRHPTDPPTLGQKPGDVWRMTQKVQDLASDGMYQFRVYFRWTGKGGSTLYQTSLLSRRCHEHA
jgi:hypothetical protein